MVWNKSNLRTKLIKRKNIKLTLNKKIGNQIFKNVVLKISFPYNQKL